MRLLIEIGYQKLLLTDDADATAVIRALSAAVPVEEATTRCGEAAKYAPKQGGTSFYAPIFISEQQIIDEDAAAEMDIASLKKRNAELDQERRTVAQELKTLKEKVDSLTKADAKDIL